MKAGSIINRIAATFERRSLRFRCRLSHICAVGILACSTFWISSLWVAMNWHSGHRYQVILVRGSVAVFVVPSARRAHPRGLDLDLMSRHRSTEMFHLWPRYRRMATWVSYLIIPVWPLSSAFTLGMLVLWWTMRRDVNRCWWCNYDLVGLEKGICPECGHENGRVESVLRCRREFALLLSSVGVLLAPLFVIVI